MSNQASAVEFGHLLRESRRSRKMSQVELGGGKYSGSYISHLESGRRTPTPEVIEFLTRRLGVSSLEWGVREHYDKTAALSGELAPTTGAIEDLLVAERAWYDRDWSSAEEHGQRAAAQAKAAGDSIRHWEAMYVVAQARFANAQFAEAARIADEISEWDAPRSYPVARAQSLSLASVANRAGSRLGWAIALGARAVEAAQEAPPLILTEALMALVSALSEAGHGIDQTGPYLRRLDEMIPRLPANHSRGMVAWTIGTAAYAAGDSTEGAARYDQARALLNPHRDLRLWLRFHRSDADRRLDIGSTDGVAELLRISSTGLEIIGNSFDVVDLRQAKARLALLEGDPLGAAALIEGVLADPVLGDPDFNQGMSKWILACAERQLGQVEAAVRDFRAAGDLFEADGRLKLALDCFRQAGELCSAQNLTHRLDTDGQAM